MNKIITAAVAASMAMTASAANIPTFPGGDDALAVFLQQNIQYPAAAAENGIEGVVHVGFTVLKDGSLKNPKILRPIDPDLESEALRIVNSMPAWIPADADGKPVEAPAKVTITFTLPE